MSVQNCLHVKLPGDGGPWRPVLWESLCSLHGGCIRAAADMMLSGGLRGHLHELLFAEVTEEERAAKELAESPFLEFRRTMSFGANVLLVRLDRVLRLQMA